MYSTHTQDFAKRARDLLATEQSDKLLYAALEVRLGVEARLQSYVQANDQVSSAIKRGWQIPKLFKGLEKTFSNSSQVVEFVVSAADVDPVKMHFIPVSDQLRNLAERFGNALHLTASSHSSPTWWQELRTSVEQATRDLEICSGATLLGTPLREHKTGQIFTKFEFPDGDPRYELMTKLARTREPHQFSVTYLSTEGYYASAR